MTKTGGLFLLLLVSASEGFVPFAVKGRFTSTQARKKKVIANPDGSVPTLVREEIKPKTNGLIDLDQAKEATEDIKKEEEARLMAEKEEERLKKEEEERVKKEEEARLMAEKEEERVKKEEEARLMAEKEEERIKKEEEELLKKEEEERIKKEEEERINEILLRVDVATTSSDLQNIDSVLKEAESAGLGEASQVLAAKAKRNVIIAAGKVKEDFPPCETDVDALRNFLSVAADLGIKHIEDDEAFSVLNAAERFIQLKTQGEETAVARDATTAKLEKYQTKRKIDHLTALGRATIEEKKKRATALEEYLQNQRLHSLCSRIWYIHKDQPLFRLNPDFSVDVYPSAGIGPGTWSLESDLSSSDYSQISVQVQLRTAPFSKPKPLTLFGTVADDQFDASISTYFLDTQVQSSLSFCHRNYHSLFGFLPIFLCDINTTTTTVLTAES